MTLTASKLPRSAALELELVLEPEQGLELGLELGLVLEPELGLVPELELELELVPEQALGLRNQQPPNRSPGQRQ
jgi:hypothetical protein